MKINLSMIVKNEERSVRRCLLAAADFVDAFVVVDTGSTDKTVEILEQSGKELGKPTHIGHFQWIDDFAAARNYALELSEQYGAEYHLMLDADEYLLSDKYPETVPKTQNTHADRQVLENFIIRMNEKYHGEWIGCVGIFNLHQDKSNASISQSLEYAQRFFKAGIRYAGAIHEQPDTDWQLVAGPVFSEHDGYLQRDKSGRNLPYLEKAVQAHPEDAYLHYQLAGTYGIIGENDRAKHEYEAFYRPVQQYFQIQKQKAAQDKTEEQNDIEDTQNRSKATLNSKKNVEDVTPIPEYYLTGTLRYLQFLYRLDTVESLETAKKIADQAEASGAYAEDPDFYYFLGMFYMKYVLKDTEKNISFLRRIPESYQKCLRIGESHRARGEVGTGSFQALYNLGLWYELNGQTKLARECYEQAAGYHYQPAEERLRIL